MSDSKCVNFVPFHPENLPKGRNLTYLEDTGMIESIMIGLDTVDG